jgi:hypothetical protein
MAAADQAAVQEDVERDLIVIARDLERSLPAGPWRWT